MAKAASSSSSQVEMARLDSSLEKVRTESSSSAGVCESVEDATDSDEVQGGCIK